MLYVQEQCSEEMNYYYQHFHLKSGKHERIKMLFL